MSVPVSVSLPAPTGGSSNVSGYKSAKMDSLIEAITAEQDPDKRVEFTKQAQKLAADDVLQIDTFYPGVYAVMAPCMTGWVWKPIPYLYFRTLKCVKGT
ncbi:MAG: hypothetical protein O2995_11640 [Proteobacteria bacterium]|nr:hypothetical protein [Pseudomonadota bacterium]